MPNNYNVRTVTRPAKPRSKALQGLSGGASSSGASYAGRLTGYVTLDTPQTITAPKTFADDVVLGGQKQDGSFARPREAEALTRTSCGASSVTPELSR